MKCYLSMLVVAGILTIGGSRMVRAADGAELSVADYNRLEDIYNNGKTDELKKWIDDGFNVNAVYQCHRPLNMAIRQMAFAYGSIALSRTTPQKVFKQVKMLIDAGADVNSFVGAGCKIEKSPLDEALYLPLTLKTLQLGTIEVIDNVFKERTAECEKVNYERVDCKGVSKENMIKVRVEMNMFYEDKQQEMVSDVMKMLELLVANGADINKADGKGRTALHQAVVYLMESSSLEPIKFLIKNGAEVNALDCRGNTPLFYAYDKPDVQQYLIESGADTSIRNKNGLLYYQVTGRTVRNVLANGVYYQQNVDEYK